MILPRALGILWLGVLLVSWTAEARSSHSLRRTPPAASSDEEPHEQQHAQHRGHRHSLHPRTIDASGSSEDSRERRIEDSEDNENEPELSKESESLPRHLLFDRFRHKGRETQPMYHRRRAPKARRSFENTGDSGYDNEDASDSSSSNSDLALLERDLAEALWERARAKRRNHRRPWTPKDIKAFNDSRLKMAQLDRESNYEVEVHEAQNSSLCNYTVVAIPDPGGRIPSKLEHIKCNHAGSRCQAKGTYCCIQTYQNVEVMYTDGRKELLKVYSGCVCALQTYGMLEPYTPNVNIDD